ncbi:hypothetical protein DEU56DRAFT_797292 [Suillus clintonianus]|uniref:uncharacterized protein n=1 Tax=Suillus clintonianus TaxID=1904413 RepID=UPI001B87ECF7|nr:uncharacterized protein DEU56DRAFT_797292 [Suillus clintonianus]KAG2141096.1 hypothetical protein DEU56DRAFT_797292 [Suillus clintonianus]
MANMRRAQSVRNYGIKPSLVLAADDLGILREGDEAIEDVLRRQLLDKDRENDKLQSTILTLQQQLALRPPIERIQELEKEYKNLDLILQGTQRENERCMAELDRVKTREKGLEQALAKLAGENWQSALDIAPSSSTFAARAVMGSVFARGTPTPQSGTSDSSASVPVSQAAVEATLTQVEQIRLLVLGMEQRLQNREEKLAKTIEHAEGQEMKCDALRKEVMATKVAV